MGTVPLLWKKAPATWTYPGSEIVIPPDPQETTRPSGVKAEAPLLLIKMATAFCAWNGTFKTGLVLFPPHATTAPSAVNASTDEPDAETATTSRNQAGAPPAFGPPH